MGKQEYNRAYSKGMAIGCVKLLVSGAFSILRNMKSLLSPLRKSITS